MQNIGVAFLVRSDIITRDILVFVVGRTYVIDVDGIAFLLFICKLVRNMIKLGNIHPFKI